MIWLTSAFSSAGLATGGIVGEASASAKGDIRLPTGGVSLPARGGEEIMKMENQPRLQGGDLKGSGGKRRKKFPDFQLTPSGLQVKDLRPGRAGSLPPKEGDRVVLA